ncbi:MULTISPECIES: FadR/GntR family transcriptional regulator [unclassified Rathayibacter]|uniref:FadR/GntR family transcriptional regulator n=1 Tax=unclassified Rathayibacter TaxID=2609250 RepID=UPI000F4B76F1|nr:MULTISPECIES: FCD domain-containing protein [unclassified Rathayibacter]ROP49169.1 GntR family transcriptional regulator [Rathayibacter sp. PhB186]ROS50714.1 GntR family transcriptional regulator [Rathayibacter sp. PhB185]
MPSPNDPMISQTDVVVRGVKDMIMTGRLSAGAKLPIEKDLAASLGVSRGPLREGVRALAILGVLETRQGDGTYVTSLDPSVLMGSLAFLADLQSPATSRDMLGIRRVLEAESAARAAALITDDELDELEVILDGIDAMTRDLQRMDVESFIDADSAFHAAIARASGNPALAALIESLVGRTVRIRIGRALAERGTVSGAQADHRAIVAQLRARHVDGARIRMEAHILGVEEYAEDHPVTAVSPSVAAQ